MRTTSISYYRSIYNQQIFALFIITVTYIYYTLNLSMSDSIKYIQLKHQEPVLSKRKQLTKKGLYNSLGPSDCCFMFYSKQPTFLSKRQQRIIFYFFQGLNINPQNLSIKMKQIIEKQHLKLNKQKITKGLFIIYDIFDQVDIAIEINIPGALKIYKISVLKELLGKEQLERIYLSSIVRSMYKENMVWGKYFKLFDCQNPIDEFKNFMRILLKNYQKSKTKQIYISDSFEASADIKGNHIYQIVLNYIKEQYIIQHALSFFTEYIEKNKDKFWQNPYAVILYTELLYLECKFYKSLKAITILNQKNNSNPFLLYYQARYLLELNMVKQSLVVLNSIKQYNQPCVWLLLSKIYLFEGSYINVFQCLNILMKILKPLSKYKPDYKQFQGLGKVKRCERNDELTCYPEYLVLKEDVLICVEKTAVTTEMAKELYNLPEWKLNEVEFKVYDILQEIRKSIDKSKFEKIIEDSFINTTKDYAVVDFKKGMNNKEIVNNAIVSLETELETQEYESQSANLPRFLKSPTQLQKQKQRQKDKDLYGDGKAQRSLSIIQQIQSFVQSTIIKDKLPFLAPKLSKKPKHLLSQKFLRIITLSWKQNQIQKARRQSNSKLLLNIFNSIRKCLFSNYIYDQMFYIFSENTNHKSILILLSQMLTDVENLGVRRIEVLPYWVEKYVKGIIVDKGLGFLNETMKGLECYEEGLIETIKAASRWRIPGIEH